MRASYDIRASHCMRATLGDKSKHAPPPPLLVDASGCGTSVLLGTGHSVCRIPLMPALVAVQHVERVRALSLVSVPASSVHQDLGDCAISASKSGPSSGQVAQVGRGGSRGGGGPAAGA